MLVFLDIDGVVNTHQQNLTSVAGPSRCHHIDRGMMANLSYILAETGARCVLTSAWRYKIAGPSGLEGFEFMLRTHGFPEGRLIGYTVRDEEIAGRGNQIEEWLIANHYDGPYVVIDDLGPHLESMDMHPLVTVHPAHGLTQKDAEQAIRILRLPKGVHQRRIAVTVGVTGG